MENDEERDGVKKKREEDNEITQGQRNLEAGEWLLPNRGEEDDEVADGGLSTVATLGGGVQNPATLLEEWHCQVCKHTVLSEGRTGGVDTEKQGGCGWWVEKGRGNEGQALG
ncbi:hypothetical protein NDU88_007502 [Pleurodeles waltl]|uniref:Uncharacterized protein n=1 Tax=Pleurodeles waltl TaxID=8319 RepID=A0AAV7NTA2_PLEWA|nr:hypothetical protein NDU88_007502 [Pleurodeles waltl]